MAELPTRPPREKRDQVSQQTGCSNSQTQPPPSRAPRRGVGEAPPVPKRAGSLTMIPLSSILSSIGSPPSPSTPESVSSSPSSSPPSSPLRSPESPKMINLIATDDRTNIAKEIYETEAKYVGCLGEMVNVYLKPLLLVCEQQPSLPFQKSEIETIFSNVEILYNLNQNILAQLEKRIEGWSSEETLIGDIFQQFAPYLKMYTQYGLEYQQSLVTFTELKENPKFVELLQTYKGTKPLALDHLLIMPIQRIPRYNLLLTDLLKKTDQSHKDFQNIEAAQKAVSEVADHMNLMMRKSEQMDRLVTNASAEAIGGLIEASRTLLIDGVFVVDIESDYPDCVSSVKQDLFSSALYSRKTTDKLHLFCFNDIFVFTLKSDVRKGRDVSKSGINFQYHLVWVEDKGETSLLIRSPNRKFLVHYTSLIEKTKWLEEINKCILKALQTNEQTPSLLRFGEFVWGAGFSYRGYWLSGNMHLEGVLKCNGSCYQGNFVSNVKQGSGSLQYCNGYVYKGEFAKDLPNGEGVLTSPTDDVYTGSFHDGKMHGEGTLQWANKDRCTGIWESNQPVGQIKFVSRCGVAYDGEIQDGVPHGSGTLTMGSIYYIGTFEYGLKHGTGVLEYGNGIKYDGQWEDDSYHGTGVWMNTQAGHTYEGEFVNGKKCGFGTMKYGHGDVYEGQWKNDFCSGKGDANFKNGDSYSGNWRLGKFHGNGVYKYANGIKMEGKWISGRIDGNCKVTCPDETKEIQNTWTHTKGAVSVNIGDMTVNVEPIADFSSVARFVFTF